jgi:hypothetical protein
MPVRGVINNHHLFKMRIFLSMFFTILILIAIILMTKYRVYMMD